MKTLKLRIKDKHAPVLVNLAQEVNLVWNYCNELCFKHLQRTGKFFSAFDVHKYLSGSTKSGLNILNQTVQATAEELVTRRKQFKKSKLNWRVSNPKSSKYSLGWIPFKAASIKCQNGQVKYAGRWFGYANSHLTYLPLWCRQQCRMRKRTCLCVADVCSSIRCSNSRRN